MSDVGSIYQTSSDWQHGRWLRLWALGQRAIRPNSVKNIIDLGCGTGQRTRDLAQKLPTIENIVGIDSNPSMIQVAQAENNDLRIRFQRHEIENLLLCETPPADLVLANFSLHWISNKSRLLKDLSAKTSPQALLLIGTCSQLPELLQEIDHFLRRVWHVHLPSPFFYLDLGKWKSLLESEGWELLANEQMSEPHVVTKPASFLSEWYAASAGLAFYGRSPSTLLASQRDELGKILQNKYGQEDGTWIFNEDTLLLVARKMR